MTGGDRHSRETSVWSRDLEVQTREALEGRTILTARRGEICLKHICSGYGIITDEDYHLGVLGVIDRQTGIHAVFLSADALVAAGWVLD